MTTPAGTPIPDRAESLASVLRRTVELESALLNAAAVGDEGTAQAPSSTAGAALRLRRSVIRPLRDALASAPGGDRAGDPDAAADKNSPAERGPRPAPSVSDASLWQLALEVTRLRLNGGLPTEVQEAAAALQDLACRCAIDDEQATARLGELTELQGGLPCVIQCQANGPYLVTNAAHVTTWLGEQLPITPQMALCRCGAFAAQAVLRRHATPSSASPTRKDPNGCPTVGTPTSASRSRSSTTAGSASTRASAPTGSRLSSASAKSRSWRRAAGAWTRSSAPCATARRARSATRSTASRRATRSTTTASARPRSRCPRTAPTGSPAASARRRDGRETCPQRGRLARALRAVPLRTLAEQAVLQRHALVRRFQRSGARPGPRADDLRVGRRPTGTHADDAAVL